MADKKTRLESNAISPPLNWDTVFQILNDPAMILSPQLKIIHANRAAQKAVGLSKQEIEGRFCYEVFHNTASPPAGCPLMNLLDSRQAETSDMEVEMLHGNYRVSCTPVFDEDGKIQSIIHLAADITGHKNAELALQRVNRLYSFLSEVNQAIVHVREREELFKTICNVAIEFGRFRMAWIGLIDRRSGQLVPRFHDGYEDGYLQIININLNENSPLSKGPSAQAILKREVVANENIETALQMLPWRDEALNRGYRSSAAVPIYTRNEVIGTLNLYSSETGFFSEDEKKLLREIGLDISFALDAMEEKLEHDKVGKKLKVSEERFRSVYENSTVGIYRTTPQGHILLANPALMDMLGFASIEELIERNLEKEGYEPSYSRAQFKEKIQKDGVVHGLESAWMRKDGTSIFVRESARAIRDAQGKTLYYDGVVEDITERKLAENKLQRRVEELNAIHQSALAMQRIYSLDELAPEVIRILDETLNYEYGAVLLTEENSDRLLPFAVSGQKREPEFAEIDKAYVRSLDIRLGKGIVGWVAQNGESIRLGDVTEDPRYYSVRQAIRSELCVPLKIANQIIGVVNIETTRPDAYSESDQRVLETIASQIATGIRNARLLESLQLELAERKQVEESLRESEENYRLLIENMNAGVFQSTLDGRFLQINKTVAEMAGYENVDELMPKPASCLYANQADRERIKEMLMLHGEIKNIELQSVKKDGTQYWISMNAVFQKEKDGRSGRIIGIVNDITERKQMEESLRTSEARLEVFFAQSLDGFFFMMLDEPIRWDESMDKDKVLDYVFAHQRITKVNDGMLSQYGATREEYLGLTPIDFFGHNVEHGKQVWREFFDKGHLHVDTDERKLDGSPMWVEGDYICLYDDEGRITGHFGIQRDITERKRSEESLHTAEAKYRDIFENATEGIFQSTPQGRFQSVNLSMARIYGYSSPEEMVTQVTDISRQVYANPQTRTEFASLMSANGFVDSFEARNLRKDGSVFWTKTNARSVKDESGKVLYYEGFLTDITEAKLVEEELHAKEESYAALFNTVMEAIYIQDTSGVFLNVNDGAVNMYGYSREELIGKTPEFVSAPGKNDLLQILNLIQRVFATGESEAFEFWGLRKNGEIFPKECISNKGKYMGMDVVITTARDVTERKQSELALSESEARFRTILDNIVDGYYEVDLKGRLAFVNPAYIKMLGYEGNEMIGLDYHQYMSRDTAKIVFQTFNRVYTSQIPEEVGGWEWIRKDGTRLSIELSVTAIKSADGIITGFRGIVRDITGRKRAEKALKEYNIRLESDVEERTRELRETQEKLVRHEKLSVLGQMASSVGHELRNPLSVINSAIYYLKMIQPDADDKVKQYLGIIGQEVRNSEKIITDLLDFARIKSVEREVVSVSKLIRQTLERFPVSPGVNLLLNIPDNLPLLFVDVHHLTQVLGNLTVNACQSMTTGVESKGGDLSLHSGVENDMIRITVTDTGVGIPPENMKKLFEPLFTTKPKGIGLGLAVSQKLIQANGGRIEVQSEAGKGSSFSIYLPIYEAVPAPARDEESR